MKIIDIRPEKRMLKTEILEGLSKSQKTLPPKLLYDEFGSELFERICHTREYYVTRLESAILKAHASEIAAQIDPGAVLVEMGSGSSRKTRIVLDRLDSPAAYIPVDLSRDMLLQSSKELSADYPGVRVIPICQDFSAAPATLLVSHPELRAFQDRAFVAFMPGSTLGNFEPDAARRLLASYAGAFGQLLIGIDLVKDASILQAAYDDADGVTAAFNLNLLARLNREFNANFDLSQFTHLARFSFWESRIEMHLQSRIEQTVTVAGESFRFREGETIHTENSYKYTLESFERLGRSAGWETISAWTDPSRFFGVLLLRTQPAASRFRANRDWKRPDRLSA